MRKLREFSSAALAMEATRQRTEDISKLRSRRIVPEVLSERSDEIVQALLREVLAKKGGASSIAWLDKDLLDSPSVLSVIVLGRILSFALDDAKPARPSTRASTSLSEAIMSNDTLSVIAEYKPSSPSTPPLQVPPDPEQAARAYSSAGITGVSVLVEPNHFSGSPNLFSFFRSRITAPMLFKDFVVSEAQVELASLLGADAVLLVAKALNAKSLDALIGRILAQGLEPLVEVHDQQDLAKLSACENFESVKLVGINSRDLRSLETDLTGARMLRALIPPGKVVIAESGIQSSQDLVSLSGFDAVLIGNLFMRAEDIEAEVARMVSACRRVAR
ncbi:MAG: indole-3-glycerol-phosphate synthase [Thermoplasmata archaeon]